MANKSIISIQSTPKTEVPPLQESQPPATSPDGVQPDPSQQSKGKNSAKGGKQKFKPNQHKHELTPAEKEQARQKAAARKRAGHLYRATGIVRGKITIKDDNSATIEIDNQEIPLSFPINKKKSRISALQEVMETHGEEISIVVYANAILDSEQLKIEFIYSREAETDNFKKAAKFPIYQMQPNHFVLSGLWIFTEEEPNYIEIMPNYKSNTIWFDSFYTILPVKWENYPFRNKDFKRRIFLSIETELDLKNHRFNYLKTAIEPTDTIPVYAHGTKRLPQYQQLQYLKGVRQDRSLETPPIEANPSADSVVELVEPSIFQPQEYSESKLKVMLGYSATSQIKQLKDINHLDVRELLDREGKKVGKFQFFQVGRSRHWHKISD
jgi:hypothetical protein